MCFVSVEKLISFVVHQETNIYTILLEGRGEIAAGSYYYTAITKNNKCPIKVSLEPKFETLTTNFIK